LKIWQRKNTKIEKVAQSEIANFENLALIKNKR